MLVRCWKCGRMILAEQAQHREPLASLGGASEGATAVSGSVALCPRCVSQFDAYLPLARKVAFLVLACCVFGLLAIFGFVVWFHREQTTIWLTGVWLVLLAAAVIGFFWTYVRRLR